MKSKKTMKAGRPSKKNKKELKLSDVSKTTTDKVRVNFNLERDKYITLKKYAIDNHKTVTQLLTEMIDLEINKR